MAFLHILLSIPQVLYSSIPNIFKLAYMSATWSYTAPASMTFFRPVQLSRFSKGTWVWWLSCSRARQVSDTSTAPSKPIRSKYFWTSMVLSVFVCLFVVTPRRAVVLQTIQTCLIKNIWGRIIDSRRGRADNNNMGELSGALSTEERERATSVFGFGNKG